jgi:hypothetical protein
MRFHQPRLEYIPRLDKRPHSTLPQKWRNRPGYTRRHPEHLDCLHIIVFARRCLLRSKLEHEYDNREHEDCKPIALVDGERSVAEGCECADLVAVCVRGIDVVAGRAVLGCADGADGGDVGLQIGVCGNVGGEGVLPELGFVGDEGVEGVGAGWRDGSAAEEEV